MFLVDWILVAFIILIFGIFFLLCGGFFSQRWKIFAPITVVCIGLMYLVFRVDTRLAAVDHDIATVKKNQIELAEYCSHSVTDEDELRCRIKAKKYKKDLFHLNEMREWYLIQKYAD